MAALQHATVLDRRTSVVFDGVEVSRARGKLESVPKADDIIGSTSADLTERKRSTSYTESKE